MRTLTGFLIIVIALAAWPVSARNEGFSPLTKDSVSPSTLWTRITQDAPYKAYPPWPDHTGMQRGKAPHGPFHRVFINPSLAGALPIRTNLVPYGGIVVKEAYNTDRELVHIVVMAKVRGYDAANGDWYWADYTPAGKVLVSGRAEVCIKCHKAFEKNDFLILHKLDKKP
jgi:hypothetical protein